MKAFTVLLAILIFGLWLFIIQKYAFTVYDAVKSYLSKLFHHREVK